MRAFELVGAIALLFVPAAAFADDPGKSLTRGDPGKSLTRGDPGKSLPGDGTPLPVPIVVVPATMPAAAGAGVVNINSASVDELTRLPGIGPAKAQAIVAYRSKSKFVRKEQLLSVRGIGPKLLQQVRPYVVVDGMTTLRSKVKVKR